MAKELTNLYQVGKAEGKIEGKKERDIEIAKKLLSKNMDIVDIIEVTELSEEQIKQIKKRIQH